MKMKSCLFFKKETSFGVEPAAGEIIAFNQPNASEKIVTEKRFMCSFDTTLSAAKEVYPDLKDGDTKLLGMTMRDEEFLIPFTAHIKGETVHWVGQTLVMEVTTEK